MHTPTSTIVQLWLPLHHTQHSQRIPLHFIQNSQSTAVVTSPSHTTLPAYSCSYLSIAHIMHVMTCYVASLLKAQCTTMALHTSLLKHSAHHHSYAQTQPEQIMAVVWLINYAYCNHANFHFFLLLTHLCTRVTLIHYS